MIKAAFDFSQTPSKSLLVIAHVLKQFSTFFKHVQYFYLLKTPAF